MERGRLRIDMNEREPAPTEVAQAHDAGVSVLVALGQGQSARGAPRERTSVAP